MVTASVLAHAAAQRVAQEMRRQGFTEQQIHEVYRMVLNEHGIQSKRQQANVKGNAA